MNTGDLVLLSTCTGCHACTMAEQAASRSFSLCNRAGWAWNSLSEDMNNPCRRICPLPSLLVRFMKEAAHRLVRKLLQDLDGVPGVCAQSIGTEAAPIDAWVEIEGGHVGAVRCGGGLNVPHAMCCYQYVPSVQQRSCTLKIPASMRRIRVVKCFIGTQIDRGICRDQSAMLQI